MSGDIVTIAGERLEVRLIAGFDPAAPWLVFLHEGLGSAGTWKSFPDRLAEVTGCPALIWSRRGYGRSQALTPPYRRPDDYLHREALEVLPALLDHFGIARPVLYGHSDGASIALVHAAVHPVRAAVIEAPHVFVEDLTLAGIRDAVTAWNDGDLRQKLARYHADPDGAFWGWAETWLHPDWALSLEDLLPRITDPVLVVQGEDDHYGTAEQVWRVARGVSGPSDALLLPGCDHAPHREKTRIVLDAVVTFLERHAPA